MNERWLAVSALGLLSACASGMHEEKPNVEISELRAKVENLANRVQALEAEKHPGPPPTEQQKQEALKELASRLQAKFDAEPRDERATADAIARFSKVVPQQQLKIDCHFMFCKLEANFLSSASFEEFARSAFLGEKAVWQSGYAIVKIDATPNGGLSALLFLTRPTTVQAMPKTPSTAP